jgi:pimeloyl-ACP methyl ester carboxylesterase
VKDNKNIVIVVAATLAILAFSIIGIAANSSSSTSFFIYGANDPPIFESQVAAASAHLPVVLVHGWNEDASVWKKWEDLLKREGISFYPITFQKSDDKCGATLGHATELAEQIQAIKKETGSNYVNIAAHSKGGIDARVYLANGTKEVPNLIMLGTPNGGSPLAETTTICMPATLDIRPGANATKAQMNPNTKYYTIAGDWLHNVGGNPAIPGPDDGLSPVSSIESEKYFKSLGRTEHSHLELLGEQEYNLAREVLLGNNK